MAKDITEAGHPIYLLAPNGSPYGIRQVDGKLEASITPHAYDIAAGKVPNRGFRRIFGRNADVGPTPETVWSVGGLYPWPTSAEKIQISSSAVNDGETGTGARTLHLFGLKADYALQDEIVILNGQNSVETDLEYLRVLKARILTAGDTGGNQGTINIKDNADVVTLLSIEPTRNESLTAILTVPVGFTARIVSWYAATSSNKVVNAELHVRRFGQVFQCKTFVEINQNPYKDVWLFPERVFEKSDIDLRASTAGGGGAVSAGFSVWYEWQ